MSIEMTIPVEDVPECPAYSKVDIEELIAKGPEYCGWYRLSIHSLERGIAALMSKWYRKKGELSIQAHLVIPPELILTVLAIFRGDAIANNLATHLIGKIWIDINLEANWPNCPWFLFVSSDFIIGGEVDARGIYYSNGTAPG